MAKISNSYIEDFKANVITDILDPETIHHEFASGLHGRKLDFDSIPTGSGHYEEWIDACSQYIIENYQELPTIVLGVASGANRLAISVASRLPHILGLTTEKFGPKSVKLSKVCLDFISSYHPSFVLVVEDVGTAGTTSVSACLAALKAGAKKVAVLNTWQRREHLEKLEQAGIEYKSLIKDFLPTYSPETCEYCRRGVKLIPHD